MCVCMCICSQADCWPTISWRMQITDSRNSRKVTTHYQMISPWLRPQPLRFIYYTSGLLLWSDAFVLSKPTITFLVTQDGYYSIFCLNATVRVATLALYVLYDNEHVVYFVGIILSILVSFNATCKQISNLKCHQTYVHSIWVQ